MPKKYFNQLPRNIRDAIERYADAKVIHSWRGYKDAETMPEIDQELKDSKQALSETLHEELAKKWNVLTGRTQSKEPNS